MITFIAEKASVGREIARILGADRSEDGCRTGGRFQGEEACVTWARGHLVELVPDGTDPGFKRECLPFMPAGFHLEPIRKDKDYDPEIVRQLNVIQKLFARSSRIVNCGDAGREGEVIQRYIHSYLIGKDGRCDKPVLRLWISSLTEESIRDGLNHLHDSSEYDNLFQAGHSRGMADWLVGINCTRALTTKVNTRKLYSLGRVQTATQALVCMRYEENSNFVPQPFWCLKCATSSKGVKFIITGTERYDSFEKANSALKRASSALLEVTKSETKTQHVAPPLLYDIGSIQQEANRRYNLPVKDTLDIIEELYKKAILTYPRTDSQYITPDLLKTIPDRLRMLAGHPTLGASASALAGQRLNTWCVDESKVTDHYGLLIEKTSPGKLSENEQKIYDLVAERMIEAFSPECVQEITKAEFRASDVTFRASSIHVLSPGWKAVRNLKETEKNEDGEEVEVQQFPPLTVGDKLPVHKMEITTGKTKPKPLYTEGTLISAMKTAGKESDDPQVREALKECGIGTAATRSDIIDTLIKKRAYIKKNGEKLIPTETGLEVYHLVKSMPIANVELTGRWEHGLNLIAEGKFDHNEFDRRMRIFAEQITRDILGCNIMGVTMANDKQDYIKCPACGGNMKVWDDNVRCMNKSCGLYVKRTAYGKKLAESTMKKLLETGHCGIVKGLVSPRSGKTFESKLVFAVTEKDGRRFGNISCDLQKK